MVHPDDFDRSSTESQRRNITAGPSREELFDALKYRHKGFKITLTVSPTFEVRQTTRTAQPRPQMKDFTFEARVDELGVEDGSGNNWLFKLYDPHKTLGVECWSGYINTTRRTGTIMPITV